MRAAILFPLLALTVLGCRPLDPGQPMTDGAAPAMADADASVGVDMPGMFRVIDGDTFEMGGETIRIANIDTPEMPPRAKCWAEASLARLAAAELDQLREQSPDLGRATIVRDGEDRYGRTLARVSFDGETDAGEALISRGYAVAWTGSRWDWCGPVTDSADGAGLIATAPPLTADAIKKDLGL